MTATTPDAQPDYDVAQLRRFLAGRRGQVTALETRLSRLTPADRRWHGLHGDLVWTRREVVRLESVITARRSR